MISEKEALEIHAILLERFGGSSGVRDHALLDSALNRPFQTFDGNELYPSPIEKAAAMLESIVKNHPFIDGNKRTGYVLTSIFSSDLPHESKKQKNKISTIIYLHILLEIIII